MEEKYLRPYCRDKIDHDTVRTNIGVTRNLFSIATCEGTGAITTTHFLTKNPSWMA
jgi:hypothetical protein